MEKQNASVSEEIYQRSGEELERYRLHRRFDRMGRLIGDPAMKKLLGSHVMIIGLGGVGSWAAESIARSGVGVISLVEFDDICVTNTNRQLHAQAPLIGQKKVTVVADRLKKINPQAEIRAYDQFYNAETAELLFASRPDFVIDAIDNMTAKCHLLHKCRSEKIPIVTSTGSGGRMDPTQIKVQDLSTTLGDPLARSLRKILRTKYDFPREGLSFDIPAVVSLEEPSEPLELKYDEGKGFQCVCPNQENGLHSCDRRSVIMGTASFVTGAFGLTCASVAVKHLLAGAPAPEMKTC